MKIKNSYLTEIIIELFTEFINKSIQSYDLKQGLKSSKSGLN